MGEFVELPDHCVNLKYANILCGAVRVVEDVSNKQKTFFVIVQVLFSLTSGMRLGLTQVALVVIPRAAIPKHLLLKLELNMPRLL